MPERAVRDVTLRYEIIGDYGPAIALNPGARRSYDELVGLSKRIAEHGYRVLLHDRRNCGRSQLAIEPCGSEHEIWADDLHHLCNDLGLAPVYVGGASAGARLALLFALRHPGAVRGLLLWRVTGGHHAANTLADEYYGQYITLANSGGMAAICTSPHFAECIRSRPKGRDELMQIDVRMFVRVMEAWRQAFIHSANMPVIGATEDQLRSLTVPICLIPGNDRIHDPAAARKIAALAPQVTLYEGVVQDRPDSNLKEHWDPDEWRAAELKMAAIFAEFLKAQSSLPARHHDDAS
jgi:pimeloyl-ACP methyl ester carboxylesterase